MSNVLSSDQAQSFKRFLPIAIIATALLLVAGFALSTVNSADAAFPGDFGLTEGDRITANDAAGDPDIFVVNENHIMSYKRTFLSPDVCLYYGHYGTGGCFAAGLKQVTVPTRDAFPTACFYTNGENTDGKVYFFEATGPDTAVWHHVMVDGAVAVASDPHFFLKTFQVNQLEFDHWPQGSTYTAMNQIPGCTTGTSLTPTPSTTATGPMSVSLASDNPGTANVTNNAQGLVVLKFNVNGTGTLETLTIERTGPGTTTDIGNVYIYDGSERLSNGKSLSTSTGQAVISSLGIDVAGSRTLSVVIDLSSATAGNVHGFDLIAGGGSGTVSGFSLTGNQITITGTTGGTITASKSGSLSDIEVGEKSALVSKIKYAVATEGGTIERLNFYQAGTVNTTDISNPVLKFGATSFNGSVTDGGYITFDLGDGYFIKKGDNEIAEVYVDVSGRVDETVILYHENAVDVHAIGNLFGFPMAATVTSFDATSEVHTVTLKGGVLTLTFNGPSATTVGTDTDDTPMMDVAYSAATSIEVRKTKINLCWDDAGNGTYDDAHDTTNGWADVDDVKMVDVDSGVTVMGPVDSSSFTTSDTDSCEDTATAAQYQFTDSFDVLAGQTRNFQITVDVTTANTRSGTALTTGDIFKVMIDDYTDATPDTAVMRYIGTVTAVQDADIVPGSDVVGSEMTVNAPTLTLGLASVPGDQTVVQGTSGIDFVGITFTAGDASALTVEDIKFSGYGADEAGDTDSLGCDSTDTTVCIANFISNMSLWEAETGNPIADRAPDNNQLNVDNTATVTWNNLTWTIPAGTTRTVLFRADTQLTTVSGSNGDLFAFDINTTSDVTAIDSNSNTVNPTAGSVDPNGATSPTNQVTIKAAGSITVSVDPGTPDKGAIYWGQTSAEVARYKFNATDEAYFINTLTFQHRDGTDTAADFTTNAKNVVIDYPTRTGTGSEVGTVLSTGSVSFSFDGKSDDDKPYVPEDGAATVVVTVNMANKSEGATSTGAGDATSPTFALQLNGGDATMFEAQGEGSGQKKTGADITDKDGNAQYVYRVWPKFNKVADTVTTLTPTMSEVLRFTITAQGLGDSTLFFDNEATASGSIKFEAVASGDDGGAAETFNARLGSDNSLLDTNTIAAAGNLTPQASLTLDFTTKDIQITGGSSKTIYIEVDLTNFNDNGDYFRLDLKDDEDELIQFVDNTTGATTDSDVPSLQNVFRNLPVTGTTKTRSI